MSGTTVLRQDVSLYSQQSSCLSLPSAGITLGITVGLLGHSWHACNFSLSSLVRLLVEMRKSPEKRVQWKELAGCSGVRPMSKCRYPGVVLGYVSLSQTCPEFGHFPCRYIWHSFLLRDDSEISHLSVFTCSGLTKCAYFTEAS